MGRLAGRDIAFDAPADADETAVGRHRSIF